MENEFRKDLVSGDWVLVAPKRAARPDAPENARAWEPMDEDIAHCPFEKLFADTEHDIVTVSNEYPAVTPGECGALTADGPFLTQIAHGLHELVVTRDHNKHFAQLSVEEAARVLRTYQERARVIAADSCGAYVSIFHNHRREAGASVWHNHSQILSTPVVPPEVLRSVEGADDYFQEHGKTVHCTLIAWEREQQKRIVFENERCIVLCPFVSKMPYEMRVFPKAHAPRFELSPLDELTCIAEALTTALRALEKTLNDPPYNFYIHTAPVEKDPLVNYDYYHWHIEIVPKLKIDAGFELGTGLALNPVDPDIAASELCKALS